MENLVIEGDCRCTIYHVQGRNNNNNNKANGAADILVKKGRRYGNTSFWGDQAPLFLVPVLTLDLSKAFINVPPSPPAL